ncbi:hypothetical protein HOU95_gp109 [Streptomyces phage Hiyaa]|jgi:hypothetical protein|uniref:Uncharacterized protein n=1 Tax=Streptomyces phage Hiyaa TaxID=2499072 RepID=A0A3S9U8U2_9CAUD|nr:hypothetical protein HOU95_gp109 [Streptomyces phage Hiyaa]AZS06698.1 hypothetical protein SEA_HIYAA_59 [Streptomyces phage Hiyaa]
MAQQDEINRKFEEMMTALGYVPSIARTLAGYLWAAPGQHRANEQAVDYALSQLWVKNPKKGSVT